MIYKVYTKRIVDILFSLTALSMAWPIIAISILAIKLSSEGPVFFTQNRVGLNGKTFRIYKLRTMSVDINRKIRQTSQADSEVFGAGKILRRLKIDELPQIFNVLIGDMSMVGPRPCLEVTKQEMPEWALRRFELRPGMTGLAQVSGNVSLSWQRRWEFDVCYVEKCSFATDVRIILKTLFVVLFGEDRFRSA
ncbi:sugar transferase [Stutzerimonas nitrititolerans]|uniref:Sugar transferase n=1 Tax=Stutzerimonas nitrititolerans TaxID=2482751 RepID=A0ABX9V3K8_9GAMM|nr:sugar transferase [Stutzerimonas nitrititolerans]RMI00378.1 sugar transferase [Stutzerimonas nitrititolerans]